MKRWKKPSKVWKTNDFRPRKTRKDAKGFDDFRAFSRFLRLINMNNFARKFLTEWRKLGLPFENETFIAAVSGGADSVALLLVLHELYQRKKLKNRFVIAHFNHNLRGEESEKDVEFVRGLTTKFNFEFVSGIADSKFEIPEKGNLEQNARIVRYDFLREAAENLRAFGILTAHTLNDQAETFLINLIRGSGLSGLSGMKTVRNLEREKWRKEEREISNAFSTSPFLPFSLSPKLIRPFLKWARREDTENYCRLHEITFRYDTMNEDLAFRRVRVRKILLPLLKEFNPKIIETLAKTATLLGDDFEELNSIYEGKINQFETETLSIKDLKTLSSATLRHGLRHWLKLKRDNLRNLEMKHLGAIENLIHSRKSGKIAELPNGAKVMKVGGNLIFQEIEVEKS